MDSEDDFGEDDWDPHAGTKPSPFDGEASDEHWDPEDDMEEVESEAFNAHMIQMLSDLQDDDPCDQDWKPKQERKKLSMKNEHRKAPSFGPDVAVKSAQSQQHPKYQHAMQSQSRLTSFDFTQSKCPQNMETQNTSSTQLSPAQSPPLSPSLELASSPMPVPTHSAAAALSNIALQVLLHTYTLPLHACTPPPLLHDCTTPHDCTIPHDCTLPHAHMLLPLSSLLATLTHPSGCEMLWTQPAQVKPHSTFCNQGHKQQRRDSNLLHIPDLDDTGEAGDSEWEGNAIQGFQVDNEEAAINTELVLDAGAGAGGVDTRQKVDIRSWKELQEQLKDDIVDAHKNRARLTMLNRLLLLHNFATL
ncbi:hypothetical protein EDB83DRAFT_2522725 [Lactarius deliciosus]|nr:hypothetical protein EDB83DRAFT_2522725 [Lactarius deliciosus]